MKFGINQSSGGVCNRMSQLVLLTFLLVPPCVHVLGRVITLFVIRSVYLSPKVLSAT